MVKRSNRCFILGSGASVKNGIDRGLWDYLKTQTVFSCNYNFQFLEATVPMFYDAHVYQLFHRELKKYPLVIGPLIGDLSAYFNDSNLYLMPMLQLSNPRSIHALKADTPVQDYETDSNNDCIPETQEWKLFKDSNKKLSNVFFGKNSFEHGFYKGLYCAHFATAVALALGYKEIYLLGIDHKEIEGQTHFYGNLEFERDYNVATLLSDAITIGAFARRRLQYEFMQEPVANSIKELRDRLKTDTKFFQEVEVLTFNLIRQKMNMGIGTKINEQGVTKYNTSSFNNNITWLEQYWKPFTFDPSVKIYNVSPASRLTIFPKITYEELLQDLDNEPKAISNSVERNRIIKSLMERLKTC